MAPIITHTDKLCNDLENVTVACLFQFIATVCKFRNKLDSSFHESEQKEVWADDSFYAFTRGTKQEVLVATTNQGSGADEQRHIPNLPYSNGQGVCLFKIN